MLPQPLRLRNIYSTIYMGRRERDPEKMWEQKIVANFILSQQDVVQLISRSGFELGDSETRNTRCVVSKQS